MNAEPPAFLEAWRELLARAPEGAWHESFLRDWLAGQPIFAELDPERGLWYLEWSTGQGPTLSVHQVQLSGPGGRFFLRVEWDARGVLTGLEGQAPLLPPWIALAGPWLAPGEAASPASEAEWAGFCAGLTGD